MGRKKARFYKDISKTEHSSFDSNAEVIISGVKVKDPTSEPFAPKPESKLSKKKQKDLQKYIEKKLKKDERGPLLERLKNASVSTDNLVASRYLGNSISSRDREEYSQDDTCPELDTNTESCTSESDSDSTHDVFRLQSAEIVEKNPFKTPLDFFGPSDEEETSSSSSDDEVIDSTPVSYMAAPEPSFFVAVERSTEIQESRSHLPIFSEEQRIMEAIRGNPVVIICGETGSGKTTQVPQFLFEAGFGSKVSGSRNPGMIGITQPRRVAAVSMAERVGIELGDRSLVSYQIRYDSSSVTPKTAVKFMTDGILLREIQSDFLLSKYSIILLDEAHERNLNTDVLVGLLSRIVKLRWKRSVEDPDTCRPLRLAIMSATLNVEEFSKPRLFNPLPPVIRVESRQHPVSVHFSRRTSEDYIEEAFKTVSKIHANLPPGGILVFLSGRREIMTLVKRLKAKYPSSSQKEIVYENSDFGAEADFVSEEDYEEETVGIPDSSESQPHSSDSENDIHPEFALATSTKQPLHVLPLYSLLAPELQMQIFVEPPEGSRLCVVATNVAETSITIPSIRYVVDSGKVKQRLWDEEGRQRYEVAWTSKASTLQRTGRAGRTGPGHCYRLFSSAVYDTQFPNHSPPEISRMPMEGLVLQLKNLSIDHVDRFPLPTEPSVDSIRRAQNNLIDLGILDSKTHAITKFGHAAAILPLSPIWAALLVHGLNLIKAQNAPSKFLPTLLAFVSAMAIGEPFVDGDNCDEPNDSSVPDSLTQKLNWKLFCGKPVTSDLFGSLGALLAYVHQPRPQKSAFCRSNGLVEKRLQEMAQQLSQLLVIAKTSLPSFQNTKLDQFLPHQPAAEDKIFIRRLMAQAFPHQIAEKIEVASLTTSGNKNSPKLPAYRVLGQNSTSASESVRYLHPKSHLLRIPPKFLVFIDALTTVDQKTGLPRHYLKNVTAIEPNWIPASTLSRCI